MLQFTGSFCSAQGAVAGVAGFATATMLGLEEDIAVGDGT
jgi:hypothetical protein